MKMNRKIHQLFAIHRPTIFSNASILFSVALIHSSLIYFVYSVVVWLLLCCVIYKVFVVFIIVSYVCSSINKSNSNYILPKILLFEFEIIILIAWKKKHVVVKVTLIWLNPDCKIFLSHAQENGPRGEIYTKFIMWKQEI
jgi:hypothetical protein